MGSKIFGVIILAGVMFGIVMLWIEGSVDPIAIAQKDIKQITKQFQTGDLITFNLQPDAPSKTEFVYTDNRDLLLENNIVNGTNLTGTAPVIERTTLDVRCNPNPNNPYDPCVGDSLTDKIQLGNIVIISGNMKLVDPNSVTDRQFVPPPFKYVLEITCDFREDCILEPIGRRGTTDSVGSFEEKWTTSTIQHNPGKYVAKITARSEVLDIYDRPYLLEFEYDFVLVE